MPSAKKTASRLTRSKTDDMAENREITLRNASRILSELLSEEQNNDLSDLPIGPGSNNSEILTLNQIQDAIAINKYESIVDVVKDVRKFFAWIYSTYGIWTNVRTTAALRLEHSFESNLSKYAKSEKNKCNLVATHEESDSDKKFLEVYKQSCRLHKTKNRSNCSNLIIHAHFAKRNELRKNVPDLSFYIPDDKPEDIIHWEKTYSYSESVIQEIRFAWQFPYVAHTLYNKDSYEALSISTLERIISCSQYSGDLSSLVTKLLPPGVKDKVPLSYEDWNRELRRTVLDWFESYIHLKMDETQDIEAVLGINENFFAALGFANPLADKMFHNLTFTQRLWILVALCDTVLKEEYSEGDAIKSECNGEPSSNFVATFIGCDSFNREYILVTPERHNEFRVYRGIAKKPSENAYSAKPLGSAYWKKFAEKDTTFEMTANSLETLYSLMDELILKEWSQPTTNSHPNTFQLLDNLHEFLKRVEENPNKYVEFLQRIRVRLYKEYKMKRTLLVKSAESSIFEMASLGDENVDVKNVCDILNDIRNNSDMNYECSSAIEHPVKIERVLSRSEKKQLFEIVKEDICAPETEGTCNLTDVEPNRSIRTEMRNERELIEPATSDIATSEISERRTELITEESNSSSIRSEIKNNEEITPRLRRRRNNNLVTSSCDLYVSDVDFSDVEELKDDSDDDYQTYVEKGKKKKRKESLTRRPRMLKSILAEKRKNMIISSSSSDAETGKSTPPKRLKKNKKKVGKLSSEESVHSTTADADIILMNANFGTKVPTNENPTSKSNAATLAPSNSNSNYNLPSISSSAAVSYPLVINICDSPPQTNYSNCDHPSTITSATASCPPVINICDSPPQNNYSNGHHPSTSTSATVTCPSVINICDSPPQNNHSNNDLLSASTSATVSCPSVINICDSPPQTNTVTESYPPVVNITDSPPQTSNLNCDLPRTAPAMAGPSSTSAIESSLVIDIVDSPPQTNNSNADKNRAKNNSEVIELNSDEDVVDITESQVEILPTLTSNTFVDNFDGPTSSSITQFNSSTAALASDPQVVSYPSLSSANPSVMTTRPILEIPSPSLSTMQPICSPVPRLAPLNAPRQRLPSPSTPTIVSSNTSPRLVRPKNSTPQWKPRNATPLSKPRSAPPFARLRSMTPQSTRFVRTPTNQTPPYGYNSPTPSNSLITSNYTHPFASGKSYQQPNRISITPSVTLEPVSTVVNFERSGQSVSIIPQRSSRPTVQRRLFKNEVEAYIIRIEGTSKYQLKLANGTCHPLSNEQVLALRRDNKGVLPTKIKIPVDPEVADKIEPTFVIDD